MSLCNLWRNNMKRTLVIGDIHGGLKALKQVLERANVQSDDHLIFIGDYVDGWSESAQLIDFLIDLESKNQCSFIYGNHDAWCHEWLRSGEVNSFWMQHGGPSTRESYRELPEERLELHIDFFDRMQNYIIDEENRLFIHAGFTSMHGPEKEHYSTNYSWDRTLWETALAIHDNVNRDDQVYPKRLRLFKEIFIGHTPTIDWGVEYPWNRANVWNLDTGAGFTGRLSLLDIDTKEFWQSEHLPRLYPKEEGRNK